MITIRLTNKLDDMTSFLRTYYVDCTVYTLHDILAEINQICKKERYVICYSIDPLIHLSIWAIIFQLLSCLTNLFCIPTTYVAITNECIYISPFLTILCKYPSYAPKSYVCTCIIFKHGLLFQLQNVHKYLWK